MDAGLSCFSRGGRTVSRITRGTIEAQIASTVVQFQREQQGRGPSDVRVHILGDLVLVRSTGIFTVTESKLAASEEGCRLIRSARQELRAISRADQENLLASVVGCK